jgi:hypothetical protein
MTANVHAAAVTPVTVAELEARVQVLERRVAELEARQAPRGVNSAIGGAGDRDRALLEAIAHAVGGRAFSAVELIKHAVVDGNFRAALEAARIANPRQLGKRLRKASFTVSAGRLEKIGKDAAGIVWSFVR